jgi:hypothetical protein
VRAAERGPAPQITPNDDTTQKLDNPVQVFNPCKVFPRPPRPARLSPICTLKSSERCAPSPTAPRRESRVGPSIRCTQASTKPQVGAGRRGTLHVASLLLHRFCTGSAMIGMWDTPVCIELSKLGTFLMGSGITIRMSLRHDR